MAIVVSIVVAMSENRVIGRNGGLPWRLPDDLRRFKTLTLGHPIVMGRRTFESIGRPLPGRTNIVVTRSRANQLQAAGVLVANSVEQAIEAGLAIAADPGEVLVVGGNAVYRDALPFVQRIHLTLVHAQIRGDTCFPEIDPQHWRETARVSHAADDRHAHAMSFVTLDRCGPVRLPTPESPMP